MGGFDAGLYRWERDYFREYFLQGVCGIRLKPRTEAALERELAGLAERLQRTGDHLIHRDFQSQNIMILKDGPALIDFQGMRMGTVFYDLASLLYDPYGALSEEERLVLLSDYSASSASSSWTEFEVLSATPQRKD